MSEGWINGAFFVLEPGVFDFIEGDPTQFEREPLERSGRGGAAHGLSACRLLAVHGHAAGQGAPGGDLGDRRGPLEGVELTPMRVLVTGSDGYIGQVLVPMLQRSGHEVVGLDSGLFRDCVFPGQPISGAGDDLVRRARCRGRLPGRTSMPCCTWPACPTIRWAT